MKKINIGPIPLLKETLHVLIKNPVILFPFFCLAFIQILIFEIIYFIPRYPLSVIFGPIIMKTMGPLFLHYPFNYLLLSRWFHATEIWVYIFISCIFYGAAVHVIFLINGNKKIGFKGIFQKIFSSYFHLVALMILMVIFIQGISLLYGELLKKMLLIPSTSGAYPLIKMVLFKGRPFYQLLSVSFVSTLFAFVVPIIVLEQKKIIPALVLNFKRYVQYWGIIFIIIAITEIFYLPFILLRSLRMDEWLALKIPELSGIFLVLSILTTLLIDAFQATAITLCYLFKNEE